MRAYSKRADLCEDLARTLWRLKCEVGGVRAEPVSVRSAGRSQRDWRVTDRLTEKEISMLVMRFRQGTPKRKLAERYGISESSVKRLLRKQRATAG